MTSSHKRKAGEIRKSVPEGTKYQFATIPGFRTVNNSQLDASPGQHVYSYRAREAVVTILSILLRLVTCQKVLDNKPPSQ